jgi:ABC-type antimicrobial peptide transport system permease subunit
MFVASLVGNLEPTFYTLLGAVSFVLLIACANVASLFLGRLTARHKEIAVRQALGATRVRVVKQFLVESLTFSYLAATLGMILALWALSAIQSIISSQLRPNATVDLNWRALAFTAAITLVTALLVGLAPAWHASRANLIGALKDNARGSSSGGGGRMRAALQVIRLVMGNGLQLVAIGLAIGLVGAAGAARLIQTLLFNVAPLDPLVYVGVAVVFTVIASLACLVPSMRASKIDPLIALRQ